MKALNKRAKRAICLSVVVLIIIIAGKFFTGNNFGGNNNDDFISVLSVGNADSILVCSNGSATLIDTGDQMYSRELARKIRGYGINSIETLVLTHSHSDHIGSAEYILSTLKVENIVLPEFKSDETQDNKLLKELNDAVSKSNAQKYIAAQGMVINTGDIEFTVLQSDANQTDINNRSTVLMAKLEGKKFLFMGDLEAEGEELLIDSKINFDCDVLKVGHHGSSTSTTAEFLEIATPQISAISVGSNSYGHPADSVVNSLKQIGSQVFRTDRHGDIVFTVENGIIKVN